MILLAGAIVLSLASIILCLGAMFVRKVLAPVEPIVQAETVYALLKLPGAEFTDEAVENLYHDQIAAWKRPLEQALAADQTKATTVLIGQLALTLAIALAATLLLVILANVKSYAIP